MTTERCGPAFGGRASERMELYVDTKAPWRKRNGLWRAIHRGKPGPLLDNYGCLN
jgi:hypothetical protein